MESTDHCQRLTAVVRFLNCKETLMHEITGNEYGSFLTHVVHWRGSDSEIIFIQKVTLTLQSWPHVNPVNLHRETTMCNSCTVHSLWLRCNIFLRLKSAALDCSNINLVCVCNPAGRQTDLRCRWSWFYQTGSLCLVNFTLSFIPICSSLLKFWKK